MITRIDWADGRKERGYPLLPGDMDGLECCRLQEGDRINIAGGDEEAEYTFECVVVEVIYELFYDHTISPNPHVFDWVELSQSVKIKEIEQDKGSGGE